MGIRPKSTRRQKPRLAFQRAIESLGIALTSGAIAFGAVVFLSQTSPKRSPASDSDTQTSNRGETAAQIFAIREEAHQILLDYQATGGPRSSFPKDQLTQKARYELADAARLERLAKKLHSLDTKRFPEATSWRIHLANLLSEISGTGPALSSIIQHRHGTPAHTAAIQAWQEAIDRIKNPINDADPRIQAIQEEALGLFLERSNAGPPQPRPVPDPAPESWEARDRRQLEELSLQLNRISAEQFPIIGGIENIAILMERVPDHGETLAKLIRAPRSKPTFFLPLHQKWLNQIEALGLIQYEEPKPIFERRIPRNHPVYTADVQEMKAAAQEIVNRYPDSAIPIWNGIPSLTPEERRQRKIDYTTLITISRKLAKLDLDRFTTKNNLENVARLFENDGPEGAALAALFRTNRITEAKQFPDRIRSWQEARDARKTLDCVVNQLK